MYSVNLVTCLYCIVVRKFTNCHNKNHKLMYADQQKIGPLKTGRVSTSHKT